MTENRSLYGKVDKFVSEQLKQAGSELTITHSRRTVFWLLQLRPDADEALQIAALAHDIERALPVPQLSEIISNSSKGYMDLTYLRQHSEKGADIIADFLTRQGADTNQVEKVRSLVAGHEFSGSDDQNAIKDADSVSFFENNIEEFIQLKTISFGKQKVKAKFDWMFNRITSEKARRIAAPWYHNALARLENRMNAQ